MASLVHPQDTEMNVREWLHVHESAKSLLARTISYRLPPFTSLAPLHRIPLRAGHVLEIVGPSGSAKSEMLLQATVACILPKQFGGISYGGSEGAVIMIDLDCRFDMLRLISVLQSRINDARVLQQGKLAQSETLSEEADDLFVSCLKRFLYIRCFNTYDFLAALKVVSEVVVRELGQVLQIHPVLILTTKSLIHSVERLHADRLKYFYSQERESKPKHEHNQMLKETGFLHKDFMPAVWQGFVTHRVLIQGPLQQESDGTSLNVPFFIAEWEKPCMQQTDKFIVENDRIRLIY